MELKQLEFFLAASECGSLSKAAARLYTSQPNVSKVIRSLEDELSCRLFDRTSRGLRLTPYGKSIYEYASNIIKNAGLITNTSHIKNRNTFYISTYQSNIIAKIIVKLYKDNPDINIEHRHGTVEEITSHVEHGISELGIIYVSQKHINSYLNIISQKRLEFTELGKKKACLYVGPNSPLYNRESITFEELTGLRYVRGLSDFFSMENGLEHVSLGVINSDALEPAVYTNSEHLSTSFLLETGLAYIGISLDYPRDSQYFPGDNQYCLKNLYIEGEDTNLILGYVTESGRKLSPYAEELISHIKELLEP